MLWSGMFTESEWVFIKYMAFYASIYLKCMVKE